MPLLCPIHVLNLRGTRARALFVALRDLPTNHRLMSLADHERAMLQGERVCVLRARVRAVSAHTHAHNCQT